MGDYDPEDNRFKTKYKRAQRRTAHHLETQLWHKLVIFLIIIDAALSFTDLAYSLLNPNCGEDKENPVWLKTFSNISLAINSIFIAEIPLQLWALGLDFFNPFGKYPLAKLHLFDAVIVISTFVLDVSLRGKEQELGSLLVVLRLWRLVKITSDVAIDLEESHTLIHRELEETKSALEHATLELENSRKETEALRRRLAGLDIQTAQ